MISAKDTGLATSLPPTQCLRAGLRANAVDAWLRQELARYDAVLTEELPAELLTILAKVH